MSSDVVERRRFETQGSWLLAVQLATALGLALCWAGLHLVDSSDRLLATAGLIAASLYLACSSLIAGAVFRSCGSPLAGRLYIVAAIAGISAFILPAVAEIIR